MTTRSPQTDFRLLEAAEATPQQAVAWRRLRDRFLQGLLGGPLDGVSLRGRCWLLYWRWFWRGKKDR